MVHKNDQKAKLGISQLLFSLDFNILTYIHDFEGDKPQWISQKMYN